MSERAPERLDEVPADLRAALDAWRPAPARPEFRAALREAFVTAPSVRRRGPVLSFPRAVLALAAVAAVLLLLLGPRGLLRPITVKVVDYTPGATLVLDGRTLPLDDEASLSHTVEHGGCCLETRGEPLRFVWSSGGVLVEMTQDCRVTFRKRSGDDLVLELEAGGLHLSSKGTHEGTITVLTSDAEIVMKRKTRSLGVDLVGGGTCLCVLDGEAEMRVPPTGAWEHVESGTTLYAESGAGRLRRMEGGVHHRGALLETAERSERYLY